MQALATLLIDTGVASGRFKKLFRTSNLQNLQDMKTLEAQQSQKRGLQVVNFQATKLHKSLLPMTQTFQGIQE